MAITTRYVATDANGRELTDGDSIQDFRGEWWTFRYVSRGPEYNGTSKVVVSDPEYDGPYGNRREFYHTVFNLTVTTRNQTEQDI